MEVPINKELALDKIRTIKTGYSAFAESKSMAQFIKKTLETEGIEVTEDRTEFGSWFIPVVKKD